MSILVEIAGKADVSVEGVVRVLTREPVSAAVKERVLAVLDQLDAEQTRVLERFTLAAVHDVVPDPDAAAPPDGTETPEHPVHEGQLAIGESPATGNPTPDRPAEEAGLERRSAEELPVGLGTLLEELVSAVWEMRHESRTNRQERLDDLAVLIDLMTTSWQGVDRRLARLEQLLAHSEASGHTLAPVAPPPEPPILAATRDDVPPPPDAAAEGPDAPSDERRRWPPLAGTFLLLVGLVGVMLFLDLLPSRAEGPSLLPAREDGTPATAQATTGSSSAQSGSTQSGSTRSTGPTRPNAPARTTTAPRVPAPPTTTPTAPNIAPPTTQRATTPAPQAPRGTSTGATQQASPPTTRPAPTSGAAIQPARVFVWPAVAGASAYSIRFFREGEAFYATSVPKPRLALPKRIVFSRGAYRWVVRPDLGPDGLGRPIVDSTFTVARR